MTKETMKCGWVSQAEDDIKQRKGEDNVAMLSLGRRLGTTASRLGTVLAEMEKKQMDGVEYNSITLDINIFHTGNRPYKSTIPDTD